MNKMKRKLNLDDIIEMPNIAEKMHKDDKANLVEEVLSTYDHDRQSRREWEDLTNKAMEMAELKHEEKLHPWANASNIKYPMISSAVIQFAARQLPELIRNGQVAWARVIGADKNGEKAAKAKRVVNHLSYQLLYEMEEWEDDVDKMLHMLACAGTVFKKTYYNPIDQRPVSMLCSYEDIYIHNDVKNLDSARRISHKLWMHKNDIVEHMRAGVYSEQTEDELDNESNESQQRESMHEIIEQHRFMDLDGDGYEEPYIVLVDIDNRSLLRVVARFDDEDVEYTDDDKILRIKPIQFFTDFHFIRSPKGGFYSVGLGQLLYTLNKAVDTSLNQLIDAGTLSNMQCGIIDKRIRIAGGDFEISPGKYHKANLAGIDDIRKHMTSLDFKEPSTVLFQLVGLLLEAGKEVSSLSDAMLGKEEAQNVPATTIMSMIQQSGKMFSAVQKRLHRSMGLEYRKIFRLNRKFLDMEHYFRVIDEEAVVYREDYDEAEMDIMPIADPSISSDIQRMKRTEALAGFMDAPGVNKREVLKRVFDELGIANIDQILPEPDPNAPPPIEVIEIQSEIDERGKKLELKGKEIELRQLAQRVDMAKVEAEIEELKARAIKSLADAEAAEAGSQLNQYKAHMEGLSAKLDAIVQARDPESKFSNADAQNVTGEQIDGDDRFDPGSLQVGKGPSNTGA